jgi:hypothetical protein
MAYDEPDNFELVKWSVMFDTLEEDYYLANTNDHIDENDTVIADNLTLREAETRLCVEIGRSS